MPRYEFVEGTSSKFWEIQLEGTSFTTTYGKIGTAGQSTTKSFKSEAEAKKEYDKIVAEKTKKGYVLVAGGGAPAVPAAPAPAAAEKAPAPAKKGGKKKAAAEDDDAPAPAAPAPAAASGAQRYELVEGTSSKFWEIKLDGASFTTTYGKIGTAGQSTTKSFGDAAAARKEHDKLVAEKTKKGYVLAGGGGGAPGGGGGGGGGGGAVHAKAGTAFRLADLEQLHDTPFENAETFMGMKVADFGGGGEDGDDEDGGGGLKDAARRAWRVRVEYDEGNWIEKFEALANDPNAGKVKALVVGMWGEGLHDGSGAEEVRDAICKAKDRLTGLRAIFVNDVQAEESEISWQHFCDVAPLLEAYPQLEHLRVRGASAGTGKLKSAALRSLQFEGSNTPRAMVRQVASADLPALEHLEVWLGPEGDYAEQKPLEDFVPIFSGKLFPKLRYLGLRNSLQVDELARALASSPLIERLEVVDLSLGSLGPTGAEALLASPALARLKTLDIRHHSVPAPLLKKLKALKPLSVKDAGARGEDDDDDGDEDGEGRRYVAVTE